MRVQASTSYIHLFFIALFSFIVVFVFNPNLLDQISIADSIALQTFKTMFISIILEAVPFILLGVIISSVMQIFISERWIRKWTPRNPILGILFACMLSMMLPVCECGMIPVVRRLIAKGMPLYIGVVFILVGPILNPVVYAATYTAFRTWPEMVYSRMGLAVFVGFVIGLFLYYFVKSNPLKNSAVTLYSSSSEQLEHRHTSGNKFLSVLEHAGSEFFEMGKYLIFGSMVTAMIQSFVPRTDLLAIGQGEASSHFFMMGLAFVLSLCSTSDAFVASSFVNTFSAGSLLTFLVFGPMLDFKSTLMFLSVFRWRFVLLLAALIIIVVFVGSNIMQHVYLAS